MASAGFSGDSLHVAPKQGARDFVWKQFGRLMNRQSILASAIQAHTCSGIGRSLCKRLTEAIPPRRRTIIIIVVEEVENMVAGKTEQRVVIDHADFGTGKSVGTKTVFVDFDDQFAVATKSPKRAIGKARVHAPIEAMAFNLVSVRLN